MMVMPKVDKSLHIKGQMNFMPDWNVVMFLGSPAIANLEQLQVSSIIIALAKALLRLSNQLPT